MESENTKMATKASPATAPSISHEADSTVSGGGSTALRLVETTTTLHKAAATCAKRKKRKAKKMQSTTKMSKDKESEKLSLEKATKKVRSQAKVKETMPIFLNQVRLKKSPSTESENTKTATTASLAITPSISHEADTVSGGGPTALCLVERTTILQKAAATCAKKKRKATKMQSTTKMSKDKESEKLSLEKATEKVRQQAKVKETMPRAQTEVKHDLGLKSQTSQNVKASKKTKEGSAQLSTRKNDRPGEKKTSEPKSARPSKAATELHKRWLNEAEKMGGVGTKVILSKSKAQEAIVQALVDAFRPMNITALYTVR
jgi:hypothetical protein